jgi:hypothetical protein
MANDAMELRACCVVTPTIKHGGTTMTFGRGLLLWLIGIPLPIILLLAIFWHH